ncbi:MAG: hypothetical protein LBH43_11645 [Treponema sp.]|nr:hypothetical protein [Treponema sp.]
MQQGNGRLPRTRLEVFFGWCVFFLFIVCVLFFSLYIAGDTWNFTDSTQLFLLNAVSFSGLFISVAGLLGFAYTVYLFCQKARRRRYIFSALLYIFMIVSGMLAALTALFIISVAGGNASVLGSIKGIALGIALYV